MFWKSLEKIIDNWPAKILSLIAAVVLFSFHRISALEERYISIPLQVRVQTTMIPSSSFQKKVRVVLRGKPDEIFQLVEDDFSASVDLSSFESEGIYRAPVVVDKKGTALNIDVLEVRVEPYELTISLEQKLKRSVEIFPSIHGSPLSGYELTQYFMAPTTVEVEGPRSHVEKLRTISTADIDISGKREDFSVRVRLSGEDPYLSFPSGDVVEFRAQIQEVIVLRTVSDLEVSLIDLDPSLEPVGNNITCTLKVQAPQLLFESTVPRGLRVYLDCKDISQPGSYTLKPIPDLPEGMVVLGLNPQEINLVIQRKQN